MSGSVLGKLAVVTGAGSGIGKATCKVLAREGATIIAADRDEVAITQTMNLISDSNKSHLHLKIEVGEADSVKKAMEKILKVYNKPPSIVINCAGITRDNFLLKISEADFDEVININLKGTFLIMQAFVAAILEHKVSNASIINIASIVGKYGNIGQANYCASKTGVELLTKTAAKEYGKYGIRFNAVLPGFINTPMTGTVPDKVKEKIVSHIACGRMGEPSEIAEVISFLASDKSSYINGASIEVTGGY